MYVHIKAPVDGGVMCVQEARTLWVLVFALGSGFRGTERKWLRLWGCVWLWARQGRLRRDDFRFFSFRISLILVCMPAKIDTEMVGNLFQLHLLSPSHSLSSSIYSLHLQSIPAPSTSNLLQMVTDYFMIKYTIGTDIFSGIVWKRKASSWLDTCIWGV